MRQTLSKGMVMAAAATSVLVGGSDAYAAPQVQGITLDVPDVLSGNTVNVAVDAPVDVCGNTVNVIAPANPAPGVSCADTTDGTPTTPLAGPAPDGDSSSTSRPHDGRPATTPDRAEPATSTGSPAVLSGNTVNVTLDAPVDVCGNTVNAITPANPAPGAPCADTTADTPTAPFAAPIPDGATSSTSRPHDGGPATTPDRAEPGNSTGSPAVLSNNTVNVTLDLPVDVCGNTVNAATPTNPAPGTPCADTPDGNGPTTTRPHDGRPATTPTPDRAEPGNSTDAPSVLSNNTVNVTLDLPIDVCGNTVNAATSAPGTPCADTPDGDSPTTTRPHDGRPATTPTPDRAEPGNSTDAPSV
ncbi:chaplin family protein, partial [Streptomyces shenzhenensis]|uniref:chaplin n=1 Tax=Streptomyces shenzhenensis TaxID=943815 RepID=UPI00382457FF